MHISEQEKTIFKRKFLWFADAVWQFTNDICICSIRISDVVWESASPWSWKSVSICRKLNISFYNYRSSGRPGPVCSIRKCFCDIFCNPFQHKSILNCCVSSQLNEYWMVCGATRGVEPIDVLCIRIVFAPSPLPFQQMPPINISPINKLALLRGHQLSHKASPVM